MQGACTNCLEEILLCSAAAVELLLLLLGAGRGRVVVFKSSPVKRTKSAAAVIRFLGGRNRAFRGFFGLRFFSPASVLRRTRRISIILLLKREHTTGIVAHTFLSARGQRVGDT